MSIMDRIGQQGQAQPAQDDIKDEMGKIQQNPCEYLRQKGFDVPEGMTDPRQITQHLLRSGQVGNQRLQMVMRMLGK